MAALTENIEILEQEGVKLNAPVVASDEIFKGALCKFDADGFVAPCAAEAGSKFAGIAESEADNSSGADGDISVDLKTEGRFLLNGAGFTDADVGSIVYASDDQTVAIAEVANTQIVGRIVKLESATQVWVKLGEEGTVVGA